MVVAHDKDEVLVLIDSKTHWLLTRLVARPTNPIRRFCLLGQDSLFDDAITRLQIQELHVKQGWGLIFTIESSRP